MAQRDRVRGFGVSIAAARRLRAIWLPTLAFLLIMGVAVDAVAATGTAPKGIVTDTIAVVSGDGQSGPTGAAGQPIVIEVRNPQGQPIAGRTILWSTDGHVLGATSSVTDVAGRASVAFDFGPTQGFFSITATDTSSGFTATANAFGAGLSTINIISGNYQSGAGGTHSSQPFVVEVRDPSGVPIVGRTIDWTDNSGGFVLLDAASSVTDGSGRASMGFTFTSTPPVGNPVEARDPIRGASVFFNLSAAGGDSLTLVSGQSQNGPVGSHSSQDIVVEVRDGAGDPVAGRTIAWNDPNTDKFALDAATSVTDASGQARMGFTYLPASAGCLCQIQAQDTVTSQILQVYGQGIGAETLTVVSGQSQNGVIGSHSTQDIVVEARDASGNPIAGRTITWVDVNFDRFTLDAASSVTDAAGQARMGFTYLPASLGCSCTIQVQDAVSGLTANASGSGVGGETLTLVSGQAQNGAIGSHSSQDVVVEVRDALGNPIAGRTIDWSDFNSNRFALDGATSVTDASGQARMGFTYLPASAGCLCQIRAQDAVSLITVFAAATGIGSDTLIRVSTPFEYGAPNTAAQPIVVEVRDAAGNVVVGRTINWTVTGDAVVAGSSSATDGLGRASIGANFGPALNNSQINAQDAVTGVQIVAGSLVLSGNTTLSNVSGNPQTGIAGTTSAPLVVELRDAAGVLLAGHTIGWTVLFGDAVLAAPTSLTNASGQASMTATIGNAQSNIVATDSASGATVNYAFLVVPVGSERMTQVSPNPLTGNPSTVSTEPVVVGLRDANGQPVAGRTINFTVEPGGDVILAAGSAITDAAGNAGVGFTYGSLQSTVRATDPVSSSVVLVPVFPFFVERFSLFSGGDQSGPVGSASVAPVVVEVLDTGGAPVVGRTIAWNSGPQVLLAGPSSVTDASGHASMSFTYVNAGQAVVEAFDSVNSVYVRTHVVATGNDTLSIVSGNGQTGPVDAAAAAPMVVEVLDATGAPVSGRTIVWTASTSTAFPTSGTSLTDASGQASMTFTFGPSPAAGTITAQDQTVGTTVAFFSTITGNETMTVVSGSAQSGTIGTSGATPLIVQLLDASGVPISGRSVAWSSGCGVTPNCAQPTAATSLTDGSGQASMTFVHGDISSTSTISAVDSVTSNQATFSLTAAGDDTLTLLSGNGQSGTVGAAGAAPLVVELRDAVGDPVVGATVTWSSGCGPTPTCSQPGAASNVTDAGGQASMPFTYGTSSSVSLVFADAGSQSVQFTLTATGGETLILLSGNGQTGAVGSAGAAPLVVELRDAANNPVVGATVAWSSGCGVSSVCAQPSAASNVTDASGQASMPFTHGTTPAAHQVVATAGSQTALFTLTAAGGEMLALVSGNGQSGLVNSAGAAPLVVELLDAIGTPISGRNINWTGGGAGLATPVAASSVTDAAGRASMNFIHGSTVAASGISAFDPINGLIIDFELTTIGSDTLALISGNGQSGDVGTAGAAPIVVEARDVSGNPIVGRTINWTGNLAATVDTGSTVTDAAGRASVGFTYNGVGPGDVVATDGVTGQTLRARVIAMQPGDQLSVMAGNGQSGSVGATGAPIVIRIVDSLGAPIAGRGVTWSQIGASDVTFTSPVNTTTDANGDASVTFDFGTAGTNIIRAAESSFGKSVEVSVVALPGAAVLTVVSGDGQSAPPNTVFAQPLVVNADNGGVPAPGLGLVWAVTSGSASLATANNTTDALGNASNTLTAGPTPGPVVVTVTRTDDGSIIATFNAVVTALVQSLTVAGGDAQSAATNAAFAAPLVVFADDDGVAVAGVTIDWVVTSGSATLSAPTSVTDASGNATIALTAGATAGPVTVTGTRQDAPTATVTFNATVTPIAVAGALTIISGDNQSLATNTPSAPLVVELRDTGGNPMVGATIDWVGTNGTPSAASSSTDANGRTSVTATVDQSGPATIDASTAGVAAVTFNLNGSVALIPGLDPAQEEVAEALDALCPALADLGTLTPEQQDLLLRCQEIFDAAGLDPLGTADALSEMLSETSQAQSTAAATAAVTQVQNIKARLAALRSGSPTSSLGGLTLVGPGGEVSLGTLTSALLGEGDQDIGADFDRWGWFATGSLGRGETDANGVSPAYDFDVNGLTFGIDYRYRPNLIVGAAVGYSKQDTDVADAQGSVEMTGVSLSAYGTYSFKEAWYLDGVVTWGSNDFEMKRRVAYVLPSSDGTSVTIDNIATGRPSGDTFEAAVTFGGDFYRDAWSFGPYARMMHTQTGFDGYVEEMEALPGSGLALRVDERDVTAFTGVLGGKLAYTHSAEWGVLVPTASVELEHEFRDDPDALTVRFLHDPTGTPIIVSSDPLDNQFFRVSIGMSMVLRGGRSGFFLYERTVGRDGTAQDNLSLGVRVEF